MKRSKKTAHGGKGASIARAGEQTNRTTHQLLGPISITLVLLAIAPYLQTLRHEFIRFDDGVYVYENPHVQLGLTWNNVGWAFTTLSAGNWHPLTWLSHMLDCQIFGLNPGWHHFVNVLLHSANTVLLFLVLRALTAGLWRSALVAALFTIHPLHVESVAWIAERKDVLSTLFGLLAIWAYTNYVRTPSPTRYVGVLCLFGLSLLSKPMLVTLPFVLLLLDFWPLDRFRLRETEDADRSGSAKWPPKLAQLFLEKVPLFAMSVTSSVVTWKAQHASGAVASLELWPLSVRLSNAVVAYVTYLTKAFWPIDLAIIYPFPDQISLPKTALAFTALVVITIVVLTLLRHRPWLTVGWFWFLGTLVPVIGVVQVGAQSMADRYTYVPLIGIFIMIGWSLPSVALTGSNRQATVASAGVATLLLITLSIMTFRQVQLWQNTVTLFEHALTVTQNNYMAHHLLGGALRQKGDLVGARDQFEKALQIRPDYADSHHDLGTLFLQERDFAKAEIEFNLALKSKTQDPIIWNALGMAKAHQGQIDEAISLYHHSLSLNPDYVNAFSNLGAALLLQGKYDEAVEACERALKLRPNHSETHAALAAALWNLGRADEAIFHNRKAIELNPNLIDARFNLGWALLKQGHNDEAITQFEYVLRLNPQHEGAAKALSAARRDPDTGTTRQ